MKLLRKLLQVVKEKLSFEWKITAFFAGPLQGLHADYTDNKKEKIGC